MSTTAFSSAAAWSAAVTAPRAAWRWARSSRPTSRRRRRRRRRARCGGRRRSSPPRGRPASSPCRSPRPPCTPRRRPARPTARTRRARRRRPARTAGREELAERDHRRAQGDGGAAQPDAPGELLAGRAHQRARPRPRAARRCRLAIEAMPSRCSLVDGAHHRPQLSLADLHGGSLRCGWGFRAPRRRCPSSSCGSRTGRRTCRASRTWPSRRRPGQRAEPNEPSLDLMLWAKGSLLVHVTVRPAVTLTGSGENAKSTMVAATACPAGPRWVVVAAEPSSPLGSRPSAPRSRARP